MSGCEGKICQRLPERRQNATGRKGALCQERCLVCRSANGLNLSGLLSGWPIGRFTSTRFSLRGSGLKLHGATTQTKFITTKNERKNFAFIKSLAWLLKGQNKMTDREELIKALCIAIGCLKSKTFDESVIGDLEAILKRAMTEKADNEEIQNRQS